jgi:branched-chain amino acid transport system permease protein
VSSHVTFLLLGLGAGAAIAALGLGVVVTHRTSGIINFAHAAVGMFVAFSYYELRATGDLVLPIIGLPERFHLIDRPTVSTALIISLLYAALIGALLYWVIFRRLLDAPPLAGTVASLGLLLYLIAIADLRFDGQSASLLVIDGPLPSRIVSIGSVVAPLDRYILAGIVVITAMFLAAFSRWTRTGLATTALAENRKGVSLLGISPDRVGTLNWMIAVVLAGGALILAAPIVRLDPGTTSLLIVPALAAALPGRFSALGITVASGLALGMAQSELLSVQADWDWLPDIGLQQGVPFLVILATLAVRGDILPSRGTGTRRLPMAPDHRYAIHIVVGLALLGVGGLMLLGSSWRSGIIVSSIAALVALSVVVLSGLVGQVSLATYAIAGVAAFGTVRAAEDHGLPFPFAPALGVVAAIFIGIAAGAAGLRARGMTLTIATLAAAVAIEELLFRWGWFTGGLSGATVERPSIFGLDLGISARGASFPRKTFGVMVIIVLVFAMVLVLNVRRGNTGRRWLAVRANERAAASLGVSVERVKLEAFAVSSLLAGIAGALIAYRRELVSASSFGVLESIVALAIAYLAGIAAPLGALLAGVLAAGGLLTVALDHLSDNASENQFAINGLLLIVAAVKYRSGILGLRR